MDKFFQLSLRDTDVRTELLAGVTTFLAMMYIVVVNPAILSTTGMPFSGVLTATVLVSAFSSICMGLYANNPIAMAPGMGLNAFFAFTAVKGMGVTWQVALGAVFWAGVIFLLLSVFNIRTYIVNAIPKQLRYAVASGIGLFITMIGFINAKFVVANPATLISFGKLNVVTVVFALGLFVTSVMVIKRRKGALILGIIFTTLLAIPVGRIWGDATAATGLATLVNWDFSKGLVTLPDFSLILALDFVGSLKLAAWPVIFGILFTDMFDSLSTFVGVAEAGDMIDETGEPRNIKQALIADAFGTTVSGLLGCSSATSYIESAAGVEEGGRTGLTAIVTGLLFIPFMFLSPLLQVVPSVATSCALVLVGAFMMKPVIKINWSKLDDAIPAFLAMILIPLTYSITQGIIWGFLSWTFIKVVTRKWDEVSPMLFVIDVFAVIFLMENDFIVLIKALF